MPKEKEGSNVTRLDNFNFNSISVISGFPLLLCALLINQLGIRVSGRLVDLVEGPV